MSLKHCTLLLFSGLVIVSSFSVIAKITSIPAEVDSDVNIAPFINLYSGYNSNVEKSESDKISSWFGIIESGIGLEFESIKYKGQVGYYFQRGDFISSKSDNYTDQFLNLSADWLANSRHGLHLSYSAAISHENKGDNNTTINLDYNKYIADSLKLTYNFGRKEAKGRLEINVGRAFQSYSNNRDVTRYQDWDEYSFGTTFYYKNLPKTNLLLQLILIERNYNEVALGSLTKNNSHYFIFVGSSLVSTGKIQGNVKLGYQNKKYDSQQRKDANSLTWDIDLKYLIKRYSEFQFKTSRKFTVSDGDGSAIDTYSYQINWTHNWNETVSTIADFSFLTEDFTDSIRRDETSKITLSYDYNMKRWFALSLQLAFGYASRDSNLNNFSYGQSLCYFSIKGVV